jgi:hypothetical protein
MAKVRIAPVRKKPSRAAKGIVVQTKRLPGPGGGHVKLFVIDSNDDNFDDELTRVFTLNIDSARQANTAIFGSPDGPIAELNARHRDQGGEIEKRRSDTSLAALRKEYGRGFVKGRRHKDVMLKTTPKETTAAKTQRTTQKSK